MIWKERKWLLVGLGVLLVINIVFFVTYRVRYENRINALNSDLAIAREDLEETSERRREAQQLLASVDRTRDDLSRVYDQWWSTRPERLAPMIVELQTLARKSGLNPPARSYTWSEQRTGQTSAGAEALTVAFRVEGSYEAIRNLINLIEMSPHFIIIEEIGLMDTSDGGKKLGMTLRLKTLFRADAEQRQPSA
ncbi:MAG: hypothetical protein KY432_07460 [Acidobacteria bacterium]|nr:hypothetical protein [Acidobacteriota bacterium]